MLNDELKKIGELYGTLYEANVVFDPGSVPADSVAGLSVDVTGAKVGDIVIGINLADPSTLGGVGISGAYVTSAGTMTVFFNNPTAGAIDPTSTTYTFIIFRPESNM